MTHFVCCVGDRAGWQKKKTRACFVLPYHSPVPSSSGVELLQPLQSAVSTTRTTMPICYLHHLSLLLSKWETDMKASNMFSLYFTNSKARQGKFVCRWLPLLFVGENGGSRFKRWWMPHLLIWYAYSLISYERCAGCGNSVLKERKPKHAQKCFDISTVHIPSTPNIFHY